MFTGITPERALQMTPRESRLFDNIKKAFLATDLAAESGDLPARGLHDLFTGVDTAKTLRLSLQGKVPPRRKHKQLFLDFLALEIPALSSGEKQWSVIDSTTAKPIELSWRDVIYELRCMIHENENLNREENPDFHIVVDWRLDRFSKIITPIEGRLVCNGVGLAARLREVLSRFITGLDALVKFARGEGFEITIWPAECSIRPDKAPTKRPTRIADPWRFRKR